MKLISRLRGHRFCAFCKSPRKVYVKKHVDLTNVACGTVLALVSGFAVFEEPDPRILLIFCLYMTGAEIFIYLRWRLNVACRMCGFDPIMYRRSPAEASAAVRAFFDAQMQNPEFMLSKSPLLNLQRKLKVHEGQTQARARQARPRPPEKSSSSLTTVKTL